MISQQIVIALRKKYEAEIDVARANVAVYLNHPAGVAEHPDIVASVDGQIQVRYRLLLRQEINFKRLKIWKCIP